MNDNFESQKEKLLSIKHEISLLYQQVDYLLRNEKTLGLLDLDVLMNRTHTLYDLLCSVNLGEEPDNEDLPFDAEALTGLFGNIEQEAPEAVPATEPEAEETEEAIEESEQPMETVETMPFIEEHVEEQIEIQEETPSEELMEKPAEEPIEELVDEPVEEPVEEPIEEIVEEPIVEPMEETFEETMEEQPEEEITTKETETEATEEKQEELPMSDDFGLFFRFEEMPEQEAPAETPPTTGKVVHVMEAIPEEEIPERDRVHGDELVKDNPLEMPKMEDEPVENNRYEEEKPQSDELPGFFTQDEAEFEFATTETLGEKMMHEDNSLAAKLQQNPVRDLKSVIGINDKFLFVNELFGGSMEKYNKSIENLNDLKTLNGAMIYLNELKIELQWNSSNEAYQKLKDLVSRKFES